MKHTVISVMVVIIIVFTFSATIFAAGTPATHELSGRDFGQAVKMLAKTEPGAVALHKKMHKLMEMMDMDMMEMMEMMDMDMAEMMEMIAMMNMKEMKEMMAMMDMKEMAEHEMHMHGVPAMHELCGRDFGQAVKMLAKTGPRAVAVHIKMCKMMD